MEIIGGRVTKTLAEKYVDNVMQTNLSINMLIQDILIKGRNLHVKYSYEIDYKEKQAKMVLQGEVYLSGPEKEMKDMEEKWKKKKEIDTSIAEQLLNSVTYSSMAVGSLLAFSVGVPAPVTIQKFQVDKKPPAS
jgi:hypothetical protein